MSDVSTPPTGFMARPLAKYLLIGSLALNLLVFGAIASMALRGPGGWHHPGSGSIFAFMAQLSPARREELQRHTREIRASVQTLRDTVRASSRERVAALSAEPFDRQAYITAQTRQIEADTKLRMMMRDAVAETAAKMTADERRAFLRWRGQRRITGPSDLGLDEPVPAKK
jgi:uncharacterized membrane protein